MASSVMGYAGNHSAALDVWIIRRLLAGWHPKAVVAAAGGELYKGKAGEWRSRGGYISLRTAYRWKQSIVRIETVRLDGYVAEFAIRRNEPPVRISQWRTPE